MTPCPPAGSRAPLAARPTAFDATAMAALHRRCFVNPPPWSADAFDRTLAGPGAFCMTGPDAFLVGRALAGEAELLTLAVAPEARRAGQGRRLVEAFLREALRRDARAAFLEVAADNAPARALYAATGWAEAGRRRGYYGRGADALVLTRAILSPPGCLGG